MSQCLHLRAFGMCLFFKLSQFFDVDHFKSFHWICCNIAYVLGFFGLEACSIFAPWPEIETAPAALEGKIVTTEVVGTCLKAPGMCLKLAFFLAGASLSSKAPLTWRSEFVFGHPRPLGVLFCFLNFLFYMGVQQINNVMTVSGGQQRDSAILIHVSIFSQTPLPSRLPHNTEQSSLTYRVDPCWLSIFKYSSVHTTIPYSLPIPSPFLPAPHPASRNHKFFL